jgi:hypothetical protein
MLFHVSNVLMFETVCTEGSNACHFSVQLDSFSFDNGNVIGANSGVSLLSCCRMTLLSFPAIILLECR